MKTGLMALLLMASPVWAEEFDVTPAACALQGMVLEGANWRVEALSNGLNDYLIDLTPPDGSADIEFLVPQGDPNRVPLFIWVNGPDGTALYTLKDAVRDGRCTGFTVEWDRFMPPPTDWKGGA